MVKILVAEDDPDIRDLLTFTLQFAGYEVKSVNNGEDAIRLARRDDPDLILLDVRMPRMTGYEACSLIRADPMLAHIPILFLSAKGQDSEILAGLNVGAEEYLVKPFVPDQLTQRIRDVLKKHGKVI
jgi:DNA-binding response OmpR family regulator